MAEYETAHVPLEQVAEKYLGLDRRLAFNRAASGQLPFPALRGGSQKSPWLVDLRDLADWFDQERNNAKSDWKKLNFRGSR